MTDFSLVSRVHAFLQDNLMDVELIRKRFALYRYEIIAEVTLMLSEGALPSWVGGSPVVSDLWARATEAMDLDAVQAGILMDVSLNTSSSWEGPLRVLDVLSLDPLQDVVPTT